MTRKAVLAGINDFKSISDLRGCINDVHQYQQLLVEVFGFPEHNVRVLKDRQVTKDQIRKQWKWLLQGAKPGDELVFQMSSHGSYIADEDGDEEDGADELLCLWDMDFNDPNTYLLDDEIRAFTEQAPKGVHLTIILDLCHAGTATRMFLSPAEFPNAPAPKKLPLVDVSLSLSRLASQAGNRSLKLGADDSINAVQQVLTGEDRRSAVLARFIEPPAFVKERIARGGARRFFRDRASSGPLNHVLIAASKSDQTSADAFIDNDYHGAFTYHFCKIVRESGSELSHQDLIRRVRLALSEGGFTQVPQLEPEDATGALISRAAAQEAAPKPATTVSAGGDIGVNSAILELLKDILDRLPAAGGAAARSTTSRALVYVHGICEHPAGYSENWWEALRPALSPEVLSQLADQRHEVLWSDVVTRPRTVERNLIRPDEQRAIQRREDELAEHLRDVLRDRAAREVLATDRAQPMNVDPEPTSLSGERAFLGIPGADCIDDFVKYLASNTIRRQVQERFIDVVLPLLENGRAVDVISHSWGTVVAYESLRTLEIRDLPGLVGNFFTVGSALSIAAVKQRLETNDQLKPRNVRRWINLDAKGDIVGGSLRNLGFQTDIEFLNLEPAGCKLTFGHPKPACAHSSYFDSRNQAVNAGIFAKYITDVED